MTSEIDDKMITMNPNEPDDVLFDQDNQPLLINDENFNIIGDDDESEDYFSDDYDHYLPPKPEALNATITS